MEFKILNIRDKTYKVNDTVYDWYNAKAEEMEMVEQFLFDVIDTEGEEITSVREYHELTKNKEV